MHGGSCMPIQSLAYPKHLSPIGGRINKWMNEADHPPRVGLLCLISSRHLWSSRCLAAAGLAQHLGPSSPLTICFCLLPGSLFFSLPALNQHLLQNEAAKRHEQRIISASWIPINKAHHTFDKKYWVCLSLKSKEWIEGPWDRRRGERKKKKNYLILTHCRPLGPETRKQGWMLVRNVSWERLLSMEHLPSAQLLGYEEAASPCHLSLPHMYMPCLVTVCTLGAAFSIRLWPVSNN